MSRTARLVLSLALLIAAGPAFAQSSKPGCTTAAPTPPATPPSQGASSGTAPGNTGSTAWNNGVGGSFVGSNPQGATSGSPSEQPATARGLDPTKPSAATDTQTNC